MVITATEATRVDKGGKNGVKVAQSVDGHRIFWSRMFSRVDDKLFTGYRGRPEQVTAIHRQLELRWGVPVPRHVVVHRAKVLGKSKRPGYPNNAKAWTQQDLDWLSEHYGILSDVAICRHLGRSFNAIRLASKRILHINRKMNFYTAHEVARQLGLPDSKTVTHCWLRHGYIKGKRSPVVCGTRRMWMFTYEAIEKALYKRPWIAHEKDMPVGWFRALVAMEKQRDPWYSVTEAAPLLGVADGYRVANYIRKGWLKGEFSYTGSNNRHWVVRLSAINKMLKKDPRPEHYRLAIARSKVERLVRQGRPARAAVVWAARCPDCGKRVHIIAPKKWEGCVVMRKFAANHRNPCRHNGLVVVDYLVPILDLSGEGVIPCHSSAACCSTSSPTETPDSTDIGSTT
jgi:hypothetical protein